MDLQTVFLWILAILIFITAYWHWTVPSNLPPGSAGLPILGYIPFLKRNIPSMLNELGKKYGNVFHLYFGSQLIIFLNDFAAIKEAFVRKGEVFSGRPPDFDQLELNDNRLGIVFASGDHWFQHRKFLSRCLANLGVGKSSIEPLLLDEISQFLKLIGRKKGEAMNLYEQLCVSACSVIEILASGKRCDHDHPTALIVNKYVQGFQIVANMPQLKFFFPWAKTFLSIVYTSRKAELKKYFTLIDTFIEDAIRDEKSKYDGQHESYIGNYLKEQNNRIKPNINDDIFTEQGLILNIRELLVAGTDTIAATLAWAALYMALHPDVQKRVQREIDDVIGRHREPSYADRINTPYTEATINELHRVISLAPVGVAHRSMREITLCGYRIPKDANVVPNVWAVHHDVTLWGDPENFRPERFIGPKGECLRPEYLIPFGIGKRTCVGEPLARMELYLYFVSLLQHFDFVKPVGVLLTLEATEGIMSFPKSRLICIKPRQ